MPPQRANSSWLLGRREQAAAAVLLLIGLVAIGVQAWRQSAHRGGWIDLDAAPLRHAAFQVDVNSADYGELILLPEVGETLAQRIVESRQAEGPFRSVDDLRRVRGIGPRTVERIRPYVLPIPDDAHFVGAAGPAPGDG